eukprot:c19337_g1_i1 orf=176-1249(+)
MNSVSRSTLGRAVHNCRTFVLHRLGRASLVEISMGYLDSQTGDAGRTAFRKAEKRYKRYKSYASGASSSKVRGQVPSTDLSGVVDFKMVEEAMNRGCPSFDGVKKMEGQYDTAVFTLEGHPGFYFIPNALNVDEQMYWIQESLLMFPQPPNRTNHTAFYGHINGLWDKAQNQEVFAYAGILDNESKDVSWSFTGSDQGHNSCDNFVDKQSASQRTVKILQDTSTLSSSGTVNRCQGDTLSTSVSTRAVDTAVHVDQTVRSEEKTCNKDVDEGFKFSSVQIPLFRSGKTSGVDKSCCEFVSNKYPVMERSCSGEFTKTISAKSLLRKLRWATLGLQFDWSKVSSTLLGIFLLCVISFM